MSLRTDHAEVCDPSHAEYSRYWIQAREGMASIGVVHRESSSGADANASAQGDAARAFEPQCRREEQTSVPSVIVSAFRELFLHHLVDCGASREECSSPP